MGRKEAEEKRLREYVLATLNNRRAKTSEETAYLAGARQAFEAIDKAEKVRATLIKEITAAGERRRVQLPVVFHRPDPAAGGGREARSRPATGSASSPTPGCPVAGIPTVLRRADL